MDNFRLVFQFIESFNAKINIPNYLIFVNES